MISGFKGWYMVELQRRRDRRVFWKWLVIVEQMPDDLFVRVPRTEVILLKCLG